MEFSEQFLEADFHSFAITNFRMPSDASLIALLRCLTVGVRIERSNIARDMAPRRSWRQTGIGTGQSDLFNECFVVIVWPQSIELMIRENRLSLHRLATHNDSREATVDKVDIQEHQ